MNHLLICKYNINRYTKRDSQFDLRDGGGRREKKKKV